MAATYARHAERAPTRDRTARFGRAGVFAVLAGVFVWKGAPTPIPTLLAVFALAGLTLLASFRRPERVEAARSFHMALVLALAVAGYAAIQASTWKENPLAHPIWQEAATFLGSPAGAISVHPAASLQAIPGFAAPFLLFSCVLAFFPDDRSARRLLRFLTVLGGAFALFGLVQISLLPHSLLLFEKVHYLGSLTGFWVNRNTAGTLLGVTSLLATLWLADRWKRPEDDLPFLRGEGGMPPILRRLMVPAGLLGLSTLALFLTSSRGALLATILGYAVALPLLIHDLRFGPWRRDRESRTAGLRGVALAALGTVALIFGAVALFGGEASARLAQEGLDEGRLCFYRASLAAFSERPWFGTGLGTFESVFPAFREADCAALGISVSRAHNTYLEGLVTLGWLAVPLMLAILWRLLATLRAGYWARQRQRHVPICGLGILVLVAAHGLVDFSLQVPGMSLFVAALLGAVTTVAFRRSVPGERSKPQRTQRSAR